MRDLSIRVLRWPVLGLLLVVLGVAPTRAQAPTEPLKVAVTVPELGSLVHEVGGDQVDITVFAKGTEDPHFVEAKPSFIKSLSQADLYIQMGLDNELGWAPTLLQQARNAKVLPGAPGFVDASQVITPLDVPTGTVDRSMGDVHPSGNPHYLLDPVQGLRVAQLIRDRLIALRPAQRATFEEHYAAFRERLGTSLVGATLAKKYDAEKLALLFAHGKLLPFLQSQGDADLLGGWLGRFAPFAGTKAVADHNQWPYFANRFRLDVIGFMEPKPGVPPTTRHLQGLVELMRAEQVPVILASAYYDPRHARFLAQHTGAKVANMAHQVGARSGADDYISMIDYNVKELLTSLGSG